MAYKCKNCGRSYEENGLKDLTNTFTGKNWISQKGFCSDRCKIQYENNHKKETKSSSSNQYSSSNSDYEKSLSEEGGFFKFLGDQKKSMDDDYKETLKREQEEQIRVEGKIENIAQMQIGTTVDEISNQLNYLFTLFKSKPDEKIKKAILDKIQFGIIRLKSVSQNSEADFFEKQFKAIIQQRKMKIGIFVFIGIIVVTVFVFFATKKSNYEISQEEDAKEMQQKLAELKNTEYSIEGNRLKTEGNFGGCYQVVSKKSTINVDYKVDMLTKGYVFSIKDIKLELNKSNKQKLKKEIAKVKKDCSYSNENSCGEISATLNLEDENNNPIGVSALELPYGADSDKKAPFYSQSDEIILSFEGKSYSSADLEKLSKAKNYTIIINISKK